MKKIKLLLILLLSFVLIGNICAEEIENTSNELVRSEENNYGVNKRWTIDSNNMSNVMETPYVDASLKIYDYANILSEEEEVKLRNLINEFMSDKKMDMVVLTVDMPYSVDSENEDYATDFYDYNDFGLDFEHYSGVLLYRNVYSEDPFFNIYTFGEGQLYYDYYRCEGMLDDIYPYFYKGYNYYQGIWTFIQECESYYNQGYDDTKYYLSPEGEMLEYPAKYKVPYFISVIIGGVSSALSVWGMAGKNKMVKKAVQADDYLNKSKITYSEKTDNLVNSITTHHIISDSSSSGGHGGGFSHSGSSGGFHGGGGGRHG